MSIFVCKKHHKNKRPTAKKEPAPEIKSTAVLPYIKGVSEALHRCLEQQGVRTVFESDTTLKRPSHVKLMLANSCWQTQIGVCERHNTLANCWRE